MRKIKLYIAASLDGKIAGKDHALDWLPEPDIESQDDYGYNEMYDSIDTLLMGYTTYEVCTGLGDWPYKGKTSYVFTHDGSKACIDDAKLVTTDPVQFTTDLKQQQGKDIWLVGGGNINRQLHDAGLIDEYIVAIIPHIVGEGIEMFPGIITASPLKLDKHIVYNDGLVLLYYSKA